MSPTAILLILLSSFTHALWNFLGKKEKPTVAFFTVALLFGFLFKIPIAIYFWSTLPHLPWQILPVLATTGLFMLLYYTGLANAYRTGDMSIAYPLSRSSPIIVVTVATTVLGQGESISRMCILGIVLVLIGVFILPMKSFRDFRFTNYWNRCSLYALIAAIGTSGYSMLDDAGIRLLRGVPEKAFSPVAAALVYSFFQSIAMIAWMGTWLCSRKEGREAFVVIIRERKKLATAVGGFTFFSYALILLSLNYADNVSYVVGFRQLSILLGTVMGVIFLKEPKYFPKFVGVTIMFAGLILIGFG